MGDLKVALRVVYSGAHLVGRWVHEMADWMGKHWAVLRADCWVHSRAAHWAGYWASGNDTMQRHPQH